MSPLTWIAGGVGLALVAACGLMWWQNGRLEEKLATSQANLKVAETAAAANAAALEKQIVITQMANKLGEAYLDRLNETRDYYQNLTQGVLSAKLTAANNNVVPGVLIMGVDGVSKRREAGPPVQGRPPSAAAR